MTAAFVAAGAPISVAIFASSIPLDLLDKIPQLVIVFVILNRIPTRLCAKLPLGYVYRMARATKTNPKTDAQRFSAGQ